MPCAPGGSTSRAPPAPPARRPARPGTPTSAAGVVLHTAASAWVLTGCSAISPGSRPSATSWPSLDGTAAATVEALPMVVHRLGHLLRPTVVTSSNAPRSPDVLVRAYLTRTAKCDYERTRHSSKKDAAWQCTHPLPLSLLFSPALESSPGPLDRPRNYVESAADDLSLT